MTQPALTFPFWRPGALCCLGMAAAFVTQALISPGAARAEDLSRAEQLRRPAAVAFHSDGDLLYVANRGSGSVSILNWKTGQVLREIKLGRRLSDMDILLDGRLVAVDEAQHTALFITLEADRAVRVQKLPVSPYPVRVIVCPQRRRCFVTSLWSHRLTEIATPEQSEPQVAREIDLPFAPREMVLARQGNTLIVADAFGGRLAVLNTASGKIDAVRSFPSHNLRGLAISPDGRMLLVAHQMLNELAHSVRNDVHWGLLMSNDLRWMRLDYVLDPDANLYDGAHMHPLGEAGRAAADPSALAVAPDGTVIVTLGGVSEAAIGREDDFSLDRISTPRRPTAVAVAPDGKHACLANTFDDSVSIVDLEDRRIVRTISLGPQPELSLADRGETLFYDGRLSHDGWMSCHSCHTDGHTNGLLNDNFSDASFGAPKRVLSLLGVADTAPHAWNGAAATLGEQIHKSILVTMQGSQEPSEQQTAALAAYLQTLQPPPARDALRGDEDHSAIERGRRLFASLNCANCHTPDVYTTPDTYDVGLSDKFGNRHFNPPSLRGLSQRGPFFHDNRAETLEEVLTTFQHQLDAPLNDKQLHDLIVFLRSL